MLNEFIAYLKKQIGQPYVWGGHRRCGVDVEDEVRI